MRPSRFLIAAAAACAVMAPLQAQSIRPAPASGSATTPPKAAALAWVDQNADMLKQVNKKIWTWAEIGL